MVQNDGRGNRARFFTLKGAQTGGAGGERFQIPVSIANQYGNFTLLVPEGWRGVVDLGCTNIDEHLRIPPVSKRGRGFVRRGYQHRLGKPNGDVASERNGNNKVCHVNDTTITALCPTGERPIEFCNQHPSDNARAANHVLGSDTQHHESRARNGSEHHG